MKWQENDDTTQSSEWKAISFSLLANLELSLEVFNKCGRYCSMYGRYLANSWVSSLSLVLQRAASAAASRTRASLSARRRRSRSTSRCAASLCNNTQTHHLCQSTLHCDTCAYMHTLCVYLHVYLCNTTIHHHLCYLAYAKQWQINTSKTCMCLWFVCLQKLIYLFRNDVRRT